MIKSSNVNHRNNHRIQQGDKGQVDYLSEPQFSFLRKGNVEPLLFPENSRSKKEFRMLANRQPDRFVTVDRMLLCAFSHSRNQVLWRKYYHHSLFPRQGSHIQEPQLAQPASSRDVIHLSASWFMCSLSRTILSLQGKDSQVVGTQTSGQTLRWPFWCPCGHPTVTQVIHGCRCGSRWNPQTLFLFSTEPQGLRARGIPPMYEKSARLLFFLR